jgi:surface polysaccharide O-acyltransferase-like enzyme
MRINEAFGNALRWMVGSPNKKPTSVLKTMLPLRGLAILLVVLAHSIIGLLAAEVSLAPGSSLSPVVLGVWQLASPWKSIGLELCRCAVPLFIFLAGYFMLSTPLTWRAIWTNCKKLLLPMLTWSLVALAFSWRKGSGGWSLLQFGGKLLSGQAQSGYFFMILVMQYYLLAKWLVPAIKKRPVLLITLSALVQLAVHAYDYLILLSQLGRIAPVGWIMKAGSFPECLFPRFMLSFTLGIWAAQSSQRFRKIIVDRFALVVAAALFAAAAAIFERGVLFHQAYAVLGMSEINASFFSWIEWKLGLALWTIAAIFFVFGWFQRRIPMKSLLDKLGKYSFQIFLLHGMSIDLAKRAMFKLFMGSKFYGPAGTLALLAAGLLGPIIVTKILQRWAPAPLRILLLGA